MNNDAFKLVSLLVFMGGLLIGLLAFIIASWKRRYEPNLLAKKFFEEYELALIQRGPYGKPVFPPLMNLRDEIREKDAIAYKKELDRLNAKYPWNIQQKPPTLNQIFLDK